MAPDVVAEAVDENDNADSLDLALGGLYNMNAHAFYGAKNTERKRHPSVLADQRAGYLGGNHCHFQCRLRPEMASTGLRRARRQARSCPWCLYPL